jgi:hypothetical protein
MDSGSHLACRAKRHFWNQWDDAAGSQWILGIRYIASNKNKHLSALRQGCNRCKPLTEEYVVQPMRHHVSAIQLSLLRHLLFSHSPKPNRPIGTKIAPLKQMSAHSTSTHFRGSQRFGYSQNCWRQAELRLGNASILVDQTIVIPSPDGITTDACDHTDKNTYKCKSGLP